jgi:hypothetical protein
MTDYSERELLSDLREAGPILYMDPPTDATCVLCIGSGERVVPDGMWGHKVVGCVPCGGTGRVKK